MAWKAGLVSATRFNAAGGTFTVDANGFRHHIFHASGTLTITGSGKTLHVLVQNGGSGGSGNSGGASGQFVYREVNHNSGNMTITVGGASSASDAVSAQAQVTSSSTTAARTGQNGIALSSLAGGIFTSVANLPTNSGGGGGNQGQGGFTSGGGAGGHPTNGTAGQNGAANTGGGGGSMGYLQQTCVTCCDANGYYFSYECGYNTAMGIGGSGYVVVSYAL